MPLDRQFYIGFYNKAAFKKAGVATVPATWNELYAACGKLKSAGYTPLVYGNGGQSLGALYYPWYDASYIAIGQSSVSGLRDLYSGKNQWDSKANLDSYGKYAALKSKGCTNTDVLTKTDNVEDFIGGKAVAGTSGRTSEVFQPMDGTVRGTVALASKAEMAAAVANAKAAQPGWAATNPQRRARVLMKFLDLAARANDELADILAREHGKTIADAKGDIQRGIEVIEYCIGAPQMMKGEYTEGAGPGIDIYSMRQPLGVVAGITPFNFPAMIPLWKAGPAIAAGNAFILKPSERDPGVPMRLAELFLEAGLPPGIFNVVNGDKEAVDAILDHPDIKAIGFVGSTPIAEYIYGRGCTNGKRVQCFGGAKNHMVIMPDADMDQAVDALIGAGYGSAGERCMAISVAVPVGQKTADELVRRLVPRVESLKIGPSTDSSADFGPVVTKAALERIKGYVDIGVQEGATLKVDGRGFSMQGYENGFYMGGCLFDNVTPEMRIYKEEIFGPVLSVVRARDYEEGLRLCNEHEYGNGVAIFTRDGDAARDFAAKVEVGMVGVNVPIPVPLAYYTFGGWKRSGFGDLNQHGPDSIRFYTKTKTVTSRWPSGVKEGAEFVIPTMQ
jgi:malonate-semialdehyde dehydrogenase (acetylating)/methylmalonate-semialdehyde dehydrogenase